MDRRACTWRIVVVLALLLAAGVAVLAATSGQPASSALADGQSKVLLPVVARDSRMAPLAESRLGVWLGGGGAAAVDRLKGTNARWTRVYLNWSRVEPIKGQRSYAAYDDLLAGLGRAGISPIVEIRSNPAWAASEPCGPIDRDPDLEGFEEFVHETVSRYHQPPYNVKHWEFYNEPDHRYDPNYSGIDRGLGCFGGNPGGEPGGDHGDDPAKYAELLEHASAAVKRIDPQAKVVFGGLAYEDYPNINFHFLDDVLKAGGGPHFDLANVHYFSTQASKWATYGQDIAGKVGALRQVMARHGVSKPVVVTELSWTLRDDQQTVQQQQELQARYVAKVLARGMAIDLYAMTWFSLSDWSDADYPYGLTDVNGQQRPAYTAFRTAAAEFGSATCKRALTRDDVGADGIEGYVFDYGGNERWVLWTSDGASRQVTIPGGRSEARDKLGDALPIANGLLTVGDSPVFVHVVR